MSKDPELIIRVISFELVHAHGTSVLQTDGLLTIATQRFALSQGFSNFFSPWTQIM